MLEIIKKWSYPDLTPAEEIAIIKELQNCKGSTGTWYKLYQDSPNLARKMSKIEQIHCLNDMAVFLDHAESQDEVQLAREWIEWANSSSGKWWW